MVHLTPDIKKITDIINVLYAGIKFYQDGIGKVHEGAIKSHFNRMIEEKKEAVATLQPFVFAEQRKLEPHLDLGVEIRNKYTSLLAHLTNKREQEQTCIEQLEEVEKKVFKVVDIALETEQPPNCAAELRRIRSRMQQCHDEIKLLQTETA